MAFYDNMRRFSYSDRAIFTKVGDVTETSNSNHPEHFCIVPDPNQSGHLDPFPDIFDFVLKRCWNTWWRGTTYPPGGHTLITAVVWWKSVRQMSNVRKSINQRDGHTELRSSLLLLCQQINLIDWWFEFHNTVCISSVCYHSAALASSDVANLSSRLLVGTNVTLCWYRRTAKIIKTPNERIIVCST